MTTEMMLIMGNSPYIKNNVATTAIKAMTPAQK
jgi:hypothetical protein